MADIYVFNDDEIEEAKEDEEQVPFKLQKHENRDTDVSSSSSEEYNDTSDSLDQTSDEDVTTDQSSDEGATVDSIEASLSRLQSPFQSDVTSWSSDCVGTSLAVMFSSCSDCDDDIRSPDEGRQDHYERSYMTPLERFVECSQSQISLDRSFATKNIYETLRYAVENKEDMVASVMAAITNLSEGGDVMIRTDLMEQVPQIAFLCNDYPDLLAHLMSDLFIPKVISFLTDENDQVRKTSQAALLVLLEQDLICAADVDNQICEGIVKLTHSQYDNIRTEATALMSKMVPLLNLPATRTEFIRQYPRLIQDPVFSIRKICGVSFVDFSNIAGAATTEDLLLPAFATLCKADKVWGVRKACAEVFTQVAFCVSLRSRKETLAPIINNFLYDESRWVRVTAYQQLGMFISSFADPSVTGLACDTEGSLTICEPSIVNASRDVFCNGISHVLEEDPHYNAVNFWKFEHPTYELPIEFLPKKLGLPTAHDHITRCFEKFVPGSAWKGPLMHDHHSDSGLEDEEGEWDDLPATPTYASVATVPTTNQVYLLKDLAKGDCHPDPSDDEATPVVEAPKVAYTQRGPCPSYLYPLIVHQDIVPSCLLHEYINLVDPKKCETVDTDITKDCAYAFPGVALTLGRQYWDGLLPTYLCLIRDINWKVRRTLAFSLHQLAFILGTQIAERDLYPIFEGFLRDLDEVRIGILRHLVAFVKLLSADYRRKFLPKLNEFLRIDNDSEWRFRLELSQQLAPLSDLCTEEECWIFVCPVTVSLLGGKITEIRRKCYGVVCHLVRRFHRDPDAIYLGNLSQRLRSHFAGGDAWTRRQSYVYAVGELLRQGALPHDIWSRHFLKALLELGSDPVPNVRLAVAKTINNVVLTMDYFNDAAHEEYVGIRALLTRLKTDSDRDVKFFAISDSDELESCDNLVGTID